MYIEQDRPEALNRQTMHPGRPNDPKNAQNMEVFAVYRSEEGKPEIDLTVFKHNANGGQNLSNLSNKTLPMCYPLFFPNGERGWCPNLTHTGRRRTSNNNRLTLMDFTRFRLAVRQYRYSNGKWGGKLFKQFILDSYLKIESNNLNYYRIHQQKMIAQLGNVIILPSTFPGSPRSMIQHYQDAMAMSREKGPPSLFITFMCNPKWPAQTNNVFPSQTAVERDEITCRVFEGIFEELHRDITERHISGVPLSYLYTKKYQKRGFLQRHMLFTLRQIDRPVTAQQIDNIVWAELPEPDTLLYEIIKQNMMHGSCGNDDPSARCMLNGRCSKGFPEQFRNETIINENGFPLYRRRETLHYFEKFA